MLIREPHLDSGVLARLLRLSRGIFDAIVVHEKTPGLLAAVRADPTLGVHLASDHPIEPWLERVRGPVGKSTHSVAEARQAVAAGADYVFLSPIFQAISKPKDDRSTLGLAPFDALRGLPVYALGGVIPDVISSVFDAGAAGVASLGGLFGEGTIEGIEARSRAYVEAVEAAVTRPESG